MRKKTLKVLYNSLIKLPRIAMVILFLFLGNLSIFTQVKPYPEQEKLYAQYSEALALENNNPQKCREMVQEILPLFEAKGDWIYYYKCLIEIAWTQHFQGQYDKAIPSINHAIDDFLKRNPGKYYHIKLGDAYLNKGIILSNATRHEEVMETYLKAKDIYENLEEDDYEYEKKERVISYCYNNIGKDLYQQRRYAESLAYLDTALILKTKVLGPTAQSTLNTIRLKGEVYYDLGYLNKALEYQEKVLEIEKADDEQEGIADCYRGMSKIYQRKRDFKTAEEYIRKAVSIYDTIEKKKIQNQAFTLHQMGNVLKDGGRYAESIPWFERAIVILNDLRGDPNYESGLSIMNIGKAYGYMENYEKAISYYQKTWDIFDKTIESNNPRYTELWLSMGISYLGWGKEEKAHELFQRAYHLAKAETPEKSYDRAMACLNLATTTKDYDQALMLTQEGLWESSRHFSYTGILETPNPEDVFSEYNVMRLYIEKAEIFRKKHGQSGNDQDLQHALETYEAASGLVDHTRQSFLTESAKQFLAKEAREVYEKATDVAFDLFKLEKNKRYVEVAFQMMEKSRSMILLESLQSQDATKIAKIPDSLSLESLNYRNQLLELETEFASLNKEDPRAQKLNNEIFAIKEKQKAFENQLVKTFPAISQLQTELEELTLDQVQSFLSNEELLIEYLVTAEDLFVLKITGKESDFFKMTHNGKLEEKATAFIALINDNRLAREQGAGLDVFQKFTDQSSTLFDEVLGFMVDGGREKMIIIPDLYMNYLPFELLLTNANFDKTKVDYAALPYLFKQNSVRYSFSANLQFQDFIPKKHNSEILAFAPNYEGKSNPILATRTGFTSLSQTSKEVESIASLVDGMTKIGEGADEKSFKSMASDYGILHLAMHAYTNEENPMLSGLIFSENDDEEDDILHAYELYGMQLNAQLAVLSACNTGSGKFEKGEGVMSLARGFRQAGVPNIVMSLWQADDESTRIIMENFYKKLKTGAAVDDALRSAKLDFLALNSKTFPHYWSAFVLMGNDASLKFIQSSTLPYWIFGGLAMMGIFMFLYHRYNL